MYAASDATTESARVFFISYMFTVNLMITQLIVGAILDMFTGKAVSSAGAQLIFGVVQTSES